VRITLRHLFDLYMAGVFSLFPIVNPLGAIPLFLTLTARLDPAGRRHVAFRAALFVFLILTIALCAGGLIMEFFGISIPAVRVAGGMIIAYIGFRMLFPETAPRTDSPAYDEGSAHASALIPLALPTMSGPGSIAVVIGMSSEIADVAGLANRLLGYGVLVVVNLTIAVACLWVLRSGARLARFLGKDGTESLSRIMGFLLVCIGVQFIATGVQEGRALMKLVR